MIHLTLDGDKMISFVSWVDLRKSSLFLNLTEQKLYNPIDHV